MSPHPIIARMRAFEDGKLRKPFRTFAPTRPKSKNKAREMPFQARLVVALRRRLPEGSLVWHTFNRRKDRQEAIYAKMLGALAGIPDVFVLASERVDFDGVHLTRLFAIECKAKSSSRDAQKKIRAKLEALGVPYFVARKSADVDAALEWISQYVPLKEKRNGD